LLQVFFRDLSFKPLIFSKIREGTSGKFIASVVDTGGKLFAIVAAINVNVRKDVLTVMLTHGGKFSTCVNVTR
jgi:hypothetical protein